jgi:hypothetical protein
MLAYSISQKSPCNKLLGARFCERIGTLGGATRPIIGVTTLRSNGALVVSSVLIIVCDLVWYCCCTEELNIGWDKSAGLLFSAVLTGAFESPGA